MTDTATDARRRAVHALARLALRAMAANHCDHEAIVSILSGAKGAAQEAHASAVLAARAQRETEAGDHAAAAATTDRALLCSRIAERIVDDEQTITLDIPPEDAERIMEALTDSPGPVSVAP